MVILEHNDFEQLRLEILAYRGAHALSQFRFAKRCRLSRLTILKIENGKFDQDNGRTFSNLTYHKIRSVLDGLNSPFIDDKKVL